MTLVPLKPRRLSKPTAKGGSQLNRGKAEFRKKVVAGPSKMPKNFPQLARSEKEGILKILRLVRRPYGSGGRESRTLAYGCRSLCNFSPSSSSVRCCIETQTSRNQSILPFAYEYMFKELLSFVLMSSEVADWDQLYSRPTPDPLHFICR